MSTTLLRSRLTRFVAMAAAALLLSVAPARAQVSGPIAVYPASQNLEVTSTIQYSAYVPISPNTITWLVNGIPGGNATVGTISSTGFYKPPSTIPANNVITVSAQSTAYPAQIGNATVTVTRPYPWLWSSYPSSITVGNYSLSLNGSGFAADSQVWINGVQLPSTYKSSTSITVNGSVAAAGTLSIVVKQPGPGAVTGNSISVQAKAVAVGVSVAPSATSVQLGNTQSFTANVTGTANTAVTWSVNNVVGGDAVNGTISASGLYTAPATMPASSAVTIRATSQASPGTSGQATVTLVAPITIAVSPVSATVALGSTQAFNATITGTANTSVNWAVPGVSGGSSATGTISGAGVYTAPAVMPSPNTVTITGTSAANAAKASATVTLVQPVTLALSPNTAFVRLDQTQQFTATVGGTNNTAVTWTINGIIGGDSSNGTIDATGLYTPPASLPATPTITVRATAVAAPSVFKQATITLAMKLPAAVSLADARFLEQATFGPSPASLQHLAQIGQAAWLDEQFQMPATQIPVPADNSMGTLRQWSLYNYSAAPDQLRQKMAYALGQIIVTSANKLIYADEILPWLNSLSTHAFGNYRTLLREIATGPSMGKYLDLANSVKPMGGSGANENFAREIMQLFTIGLWQMNQDGSYVLDGQGNKIPTYNQQTVQQVALALTGWTYATAPGNTPQSLNNEYFGAPMETRPANHDMGPKSFLGCDVPAGQSVDDDMDSVIDCLMQHPNTAPFIATRLIRLIVTSNPSPAYIQRVADVFGAVNGGTPGDLKATLIAILTDPEARNDNAPATAGRLKDAIGQTVGVVRAFGGQFSSQNQITYLYDYMSQGILTPPSVFNWFSPLYKVPNSTTFGPEFQIYSATDATLRGNFMYTLISGLANHPTFAPYGNDMAGAVEVANQMFLYGRMPAAMKQAIITAATPGYDAQARITTVIYLTVLSGFYAVQY